MWSAGNLLLSCFFLQIPVQLVEKAEMDSFALTHAVDKKIKVIDVNTVKQEKLS